MPELIHNAPWYQRLLSLSHGIIDTDLAKDFNPEDLLVEDVEQLFLRGETKSSCACSTPEFFRDVLGNVLIHLCKSCAHGLFGVIEVNTGQE